MCLRDRQAKPVSGCAPVTEGLQDSVKLALRQRPILAPVVPIKTRHRGRGGRRRTI